MVCCIDSTPCYYSFYWEKFWRASSDQYFYRYLKCCFVFSISFDLSWFVWTIADGWSRPCHPKSEKIKFNSVDSSSKLYVISILYSETDFQNVLSFQLISSKLPSNADAQNHNKIHFTKLSLNIYHSQNL